MLLLKGRGAVILGFDCTSPLSNLEKWLQFEIGDLSFEKSEEVVGLNGTSEIVD